jgi:hypothetical protein
VLSAPAYLAPVFNISQARLGESLSADKAKLSSDMETQLQKLENALRAATAAKDKAERTLLETQALHSRALETERHRIEDQARTQARNELRAQLEAELRPLLERQIREEINLEASHAKEASQTQKGSMASKPGAAQAMPTVANSSRTLPAPSITVQSKPVLEKVASTGDVSDRFSALREKALAFKNRAQETRAVSAQEDEAARREAANDVLASMHALNRRVSIKRRAKPPGGENSDPEPHEVRVGGLAPR